MQEADLIKKISQIKTNKDLIELLNENPPENWLKVHPEISTYKYLPIDKVEFLLRSIFGLNYKIEVLDSKEMFNATSVSIRVHFREFDEPKNWYFYDGVGAEEPEKNIVENVKTKDFKDYSVSAALPNAKSNAVKNACYGFGKLFGSDLNRNDTIIKEARLNPKQKLDKIKKMFQELEENIPSKDFSNYKRIIENEEVNSYNKALVQLEEIQNKIKK